MRDSIRKATDALMEVVRWSSGASGRIQWYGLRRLWALASVASAIALNGCSNPPPPPISVSLNPSSGLAIDAQSSATLGVEATVADDGSGKGVTWSLIGPGSLSATTSSVTYLPPTAAVASPQVATLTANFHRRHDQERVGADHRQSLPHHALSDARERHGGCSV